MRLENINFHYIIVTMLAFINGKIRNKNFTNSYAVIEANSIGYKVDVSLSTLSQLKLDTGLTLYIHTMANEAGIRLCGFLTRAEQEFFELLISVSGIGAKAAFKILDGFSIDQLCSAIMREDEKLLAEAKGIGKKTAQRIILELKNKVNGFASLKPQENYGNAEVYSVLNDLGFNSNDVEAKLKLAQEQNIDNDVESLLRFCLASHPNA